MEVQRRELQTGLEAQRRTTLGIWKATNLGNSKKEHPWQNSLEMKFVPVPGTQVLFSIWHTRVKDFRAFVKETGHEATEGMRSCGKNGWEQRGTTWKQPGFKQEETHPVVGINWEDARVFCIWLTKRESGTGMLTYEVIQIAD
jgi:Sulfatase-modifying factor enzyme 1